MLGCAPPSSGSGGDVHILGSVGVETLPHVWSAVCIAKVSLPSSHNGTVIRCTALSTFLPGCRRARWWRYVVNDWKMMPINSLCLLKHGTEGWKTCLKNWNNRSGSVVVKALWYKREGRGFETRWGEWTFQFTWSFHRTRPWGGKIR
jgi:hypothetical protein